MDVALIVGHTSEVPGATHQEFGISEYQFNERLALAVSEALRGPSSQVIYRARPNDYTGLPDLINALDPSFIVAFHANSHDTPVSGSEVLHWHRSKKAAVLAGMLQHEILGALGLRDRGLKPISDQRGAHLLQRTNAPAAIIEPIFLSNSYDLFWAAWKWEKLVLGCKNAIEQYHAWLKTQ